MKVDLTKLKWGTWFEDEQGNTYPNTPSTELPDKDYYTYHCVYPCIYIHEVDTYTCHPEYLHENNSFYQAMLHFKWFRNWMRKRHRKDMTFKRASTSHSTYGAKFAQNCIVAMVNSGDFTLEEAIYVFNNSCERCMNVLLHKYLNGEEGYPEYSEEWHKCNTVCEWCKDES